jgi:hypothetical protein
VRLVPIEVEPIGSVAGGRTEAVDDDWGGVESTIILDAGRVPPDATLGVTVCELVAVDGLELRVRGLDAVDGSPVLDVKPYMAEFAPRGPVRQPAWSSELMQGYW